MKKYIVFLISVLVISCSPSKVAEEEKHGGPNVIYILADDLGYGDLSCYGQTKFSTPNIDRLAARGMKFTQHYSGATVCAPSRSSLMTGLHTGHTPVRGNKELLGEGQSPLPHDAFTIAELMKAKGYSTGAFGKWGLGFVGTEGDPNNQGFDEFYGYNCQRMAHRYYPTHLWHNDQKAMLAGNDWTQTTTYAPDEIQQKTLEFIKENKDQPFFAFVPLVQPHAELIVPDDEILAQFKGKYEEQPFTQPHGYMADYGAEDFEFQKYSSQATPFAVFAAMVTRIDNYVGEIMALVDESGLAENTIIIFTSDNGPAAEGGANPDFFNSSGSLKGIKRDLYEGGVRVPMIVSWPEHIQEGSTNDHISAFWDVMPTLAQLTQQEITHEIDGISFAPTLLGAAEQKEHEYLYWEFHERGGRQAVRMGNWKGVIYNVQNPDLRKLELYDLSTDLGEQEDVAAQHPEIAAQITAIIKREHVESAAFPLLGAP